MSGVQINLSPSFQKSLARLEKRDQGIVKQAVMDFMLAPEAPGLRFHPLNMREKRFHSFSPTMDLRVVVLKDGARHVLMYVDHHDKAYAWAERRQVERHPVTGSAQIVEFEEVVREEVTYVPRQVEAPPLFAAEAGDYLLALGVPPVYLDLVRSVDEDGLIDLCQRLPEEAQEALLELAAGNRPEPAPRIAPELEPDPFEHPDARRRFWVATDEEALTQALARPWAQWLVFLHPSQRVAVERNFNGPARVSGAAGTGKSVVAMHRAAHLARISQGGRILLTTFSKTLAARLADGMDEILGPASINRGRIHVTHLHEYGRNVIANAGRQFSIADEAKVLDLIESERGDVAVDEFPTRFLAAEWAAVIDYWGVRDWQTYRQIQRTGRGQALSPRKRKIIWPVFEAVRRELENRALLTWGDVCEQAGGMLRTADARPFRHVVVDEAQDLGPRELRFVAGLAPAGPRALFFAGDTGQRIYRYPYSWLTVGVDVRGRAQRLKVNYRTSEQIKRFADGLLPQRLEAPDGLPEDRSTISLLSGPEPEVVGGQGGDAERAALEAWLKGLLDRGVEPKEIAVLGRTRIVLRERAIPVLEQLGLEQAPLSVDTEVPKTAVNVGTLHSAKGLEFRAVAIVGCDDDVIPLRQALEAETEDEARRIAEAREQHLLYVGCTRARECLLLCYAQRLTRFVDGQRILQHKAVRDSGL